VDLFSVKAIEVTAWQSDIAVCLCCLTYGSSITGHRSLLTTAMQPDLQHVLDQPVCIMLYSQFLCCTRVHLFVWYSVAWGSVTFWW